ncbi:MAG TPA: hypothetical protein VK781_02725 [Solirubrobacteraceae bacterium]|jgi:hypothetical protein|nr:hypothetical protein [Solirubrobacteraceae bacterium]
MRVLKQAVAAAGQSAFASVAAGHDDLALDMSCEDIRVVVCQP